LSRHFSPKNACVCTDFSLHRFCLPIFPCNDFFPRRSVLTRPRPPAGRGDAAGRRASPSLERAFSHTNTPQTPPHPPPLPQKKKPQTKPPTQKKNPTPTNKLRICLVFGVLLSMLLPPGEPRLGKKLFSFFLKHPILPEGALPSGPVFFRACLRTRSPPGFFDQREALLFGEGNPPPPADVHPFSQGTSGLFFLSFPLQLEKTFPFLFYISPSFLMG